MIKDFIPYEQALELKELGFKEPCFEYWKMKNWIIHEKTRTDGYTHADQVCGSVLYQQAFRWFREKHNLYHFISSESDSARMSASIRKKIVTDNSKFEFWSIIEYVRAKKASPYNTFKNHEEAELECLKKMIEYCKRDFKRDVF